MLPISLTSQMWSHIGFMSATRYSYHHSSHYWASLLLVAKANRELTNITCWFLSLAAIAYNPLCVSVICAFAWPVIIDISIMSLGTLLTPFTITAEFVLPRGYLNWLKGLPQPIEPPAGCAPENLWQEICREPIAIQQSYRVIPELTEILNNPAYQERLTPYECPVSLEVMQDPVVVLSTSEDKTHKYQHTFDLRSVTDNVQKADARNRMLDPLNRMPIIGVFRHESLRAELCEIAKTPLDYSRIIPRQS